MLPTHWSLQRQCEKDEVNLKSAGEHPRVRASCLVLQVDGLYAPGSTCPTPLDRSPYLAATALCQHPSPNRKFARFLRRWN